MRRDDLTGVKLLLMHGAQLHIGDRDGATPTQRALEAHLERGGGEVLAHILEPALVLPPRRHRVCS